MFKTIKKIHYGARVLLSRGGGEPETIQVNGRATTILHGGEGPTFVYLHSTLGESFLWFPFYQAWARKFRVLVPTHPGYGSKAERPQWLRSARDVAVMYRWLLGDLGIERASLVGLGFGGWIAAEMATMAPHDLHRLILDGAMGVKPPEGDILDQAIVSYLDYARAGFHDQAAFARIYGDVSTDQLVEWDLCREMSFRIAWKPYMYSQTLPHLLGAVQTPALVVWGDDDKVVPMSAAKRYIEVLPNARLEIVKGCGHCVDMEQPETLAKLVTNFIG